MCNGDCTPLAESWVLGRPDAGYLALRWRTKLRLLAAHHEPVHRLPPDAEHGRGHALVQRHQFDKESAVAGEPR